MSFFCFMCGSCGMWGVREIPSFGKNPLALKGKVFTCKFCWKGQQIRQKKVFGLALRSYGPYSTGQLAQTVCSRENAARGGIAVRR